jgi:hypothetical protein
MATSLYHTLTENGGKSFSYAGFEFRELQRQEYTGNNCIFAVGIVEGFPPDAYYLWIEKGDIADPTILLLRPDELASLAWLASGALWSHLEAELRGADGN